MQPLLQDQDLVLVQKRWPCSSLKNGDVILFQHPHHGLIIKGMVKDNSNSNHIHLFGLSSLSTPSQQLSHGDQKNVVGRVFLRISPRKGIGLIKRISLDQIPENLQN